jgi:hypothetical protein
VIVGVVIVNEAAPLSKLPSDPVAVTVYAVDEAVPVIVTVQLIVPVLLVSPQLVVDNVAPLEIDSVTEIVAVEEVGVNPVPATVTNVPLGPWLGVSVIVGLVPVNVAVAVSPAGLPVAVTVFAVPLLLNLKPVDVLAVKVQPENDPELTVQVEGEVERGVVELPTVKVTLVSGPANPLPDAVTVIPLGPDDGVSVRLGVGGGGGCLLLEERELGTAVKMEEMARTPVDSGTYPGGGLGEEGGEMEVVTARAPLGMAVPLPVALDPGLSPIGARTLERRKRATNRRTRTAVRPAMVVERLRRMAAVPLGRMPPTLLHPTRIIATTCSDW